MELPIKESEALGLPCFDLVPAERGQPVVAYWGGRRSDLPEEFPEFVTQLKSQAHFLSVDQALFDQLGLQGRGPLALSMITTIEDDERLDHVNVSTGKISEVAMKLRVTEQHVLDLIEEGQLQAVNVGGSDRKFWRIPVEAYDAFLECRHSFNV
jgi:excisionase family DNA binding protein